MANRNNTRETTVRQVSDLPDMQRIGPAIREDIYYLSARPVTA